MNTSFERGKDRTDEWYTPKHIIDSLTCAGANFELDPCTFVNPPYQIAKNTFNKYQDGLTKDWFGNVWCNPPYSTFLIKKFIAKLASHGNGIALIFNRMDNSLWHELIFPNADAILILRGRLRFMNIDGVVSDPAGCGSVLVAFGKENAECLERCGIDGKFINLKNER